MYSAPTILLPTPQWAREGLMNAVCVADVLRDLRRGRQVYLQLLFPQTVQVCFGTIVRLHAVSSDEEFFCVKRRIVSSGSRVCYWSSGMCKIDGPAWYRSRSRRTQHGHRVTGIYRWRLARMCRSWTSILWSTAGTVGLVANSGVYAPSARVSFHYLFSFRS